MQRSNIELQMLGRADDFPLSGGDGLQIGATYPKSAGQDFNFWQIPPFIIRQRVTRLTPRNFAAADIPKSSGPEVVAGFS